MEKNEFTRGPKDKLTNVWLSAKNFFLHHICRQKHGKANSSILDNHILDYHDDYCNITEREFDEKYNRSQRWGNYHPADLHQWYEIGRAHV